MNRNYTKKEVYIIMVNEEENIENEVENLENEEEIEAENMDEETEELIEDEKLPFAKAEVVRLMKKYLDDDKMIRDRVKVEMNKFLGEVLANVCKQLNQYPYSTIEYDMFKEAAYAYRNLERINEEKIRILKHLEAIKADCDALSMDVKATLKLTDRIDLDEDETTDNLF